MLKLILIAICALIVLLGGAKGRRLRNMSQKHDERAEKLRERIDTFSNYSKLASARLVEAEDQRKELQAEIDRASQKIDEIRRTALAAAADEPSEYYVFDRVSGRRGTIWMVVVEALGDRPVWTETRHYLVISETAQDAKNRIKERFSARGEFGVSDAIAKADF
jgi:chromosome segregation ATPase